MLKTKDFFKSAAVGVLLASALFALPGKADALAISKFDRMSPDDQSRYAALLVGSSIAWLWGEGREAEGNKVVALFTNVPGRKYPEGFSKFLANLREIREAQKTTTETIDVEVAFWSTLEGYGIIIPSDVMMQFAKDFKPQDKGFADNNRPSAKPRADAGAPGEFRLAAG